MPTPRENSTAAENKADLRRIPKVDALVERLRREESFREVPAGLLLEAVRGVIEDRRRRVIEGEAVDIESLFAGDAIARAVRARIDSTLERRHVSVINATGILLHTGLGRAPLSRSAREAAFDAGRYAVVEVSPHTGERDLREERVARLVCDITGAEAATVVNNNAAAVLLTLGALAQGRTVVCSRGEMVEIGGGFRMPAVMKTSGCTLREVGTTNRTYARDYEEAIDDDVALLMKVHTSNYRVVGFTATPSEEELAAIARDRGIPFVYDLGAGLLRPVGVEPLVEEPTVRGSLARGVDLVTFSGDKLLSGPQAGVIAGRADLVAAIRRHPLFRAVRPGKLDLAALEATLIEFRRQPDGIPDLPLFVALARSLDDLRKTAEDVRTRLVGACAEIEAQVVETEGFLGSGSAPVRPVPGVAVAIAHRELGAAEVLDRLRAATPKIFARIDRDRVLLEMRTVFYDQLDDLVRGASRALSAAGAS